MSKPKSPYPKYQRAVWDHVWNGFKAGLRARIRVSIEAVVAVAASLALYKEFGTAEAPFTLSLDKLWGLLVLPVVFIVLHLVWSWATAPRAIYKENQEELIELRGIVTNGIEALDQKSDDQSKRLQQAKLRISAMAATIEIPHKGGDPAINIHLNLNKFLQQRLFGTAQTDWKADTAAELRAIANESICRQYSQCFETATPESSATRYLACLASTITLSDLRGFAPAADPKETEQHRQDLRERLARLIAAIEKCADDAPFGYSFSQNAVTAWYQGAVHLLASSVNMGKRQQFTGPGSDEHYLRLSVNSLRTISATLTVDDLA